VAQVVQILVVVAEVDLQGNNKSQVVAVVAEL
jgi:hypothetical protein